MQTSLPRKFARNAIISFLAGLLTVGMAWAGASLAPIPTDAGARAANAFAGLAQQTSVGDGQLLVGVDKTSLYPRVEDFQGQFPGATWLRDHEACATLSEATFTEVFDDPEHAGHLATSTTSPWPENPDCLYMGGFGIGPMNPITDWDRAPGDPDYVQDEDPQTGYGLWIRTTVISDGEDTATLTVIDAEGFLYEYVSKCLAAQLVEGCGSREIAESMGAELGIDPAGVHIASTHSHAAIELLGGWGFVPDWYFNQVYNDIKASIRKAHADRRPAFVEVGEELARPHNRERRDTYRSAEEQHLSWLRAVDVATSEPIVTIGAYAGHPTSYGTNSGRAHADWVGPFTARLEDNFGGMGMHFMTGLGNMSNATGRTGATALADLVPAIGEGKLLTDTDLRTAARSWQQPVTNAPLNALGLPGFFDRSFSATPATIRTGKTPDTAPCLSASPASVELQTSALRIGDDFALTSAPGEVFSNLTNTIKEQSGAAVTMPLGQSNDALGYMPQQFELSEANQQGAGFVLGGVLIVNYEDSYAIDRCTGDMVLETQIQLLDQLRDR